MLAVMHCREGADRTFGGMRVERPRRVMKLMALVLIVSQTYISIHGLDQEYCLVGWSYEDLGDAWLTTVKVGTEHNQQCQGSLSHPASKLNCCSEAYRFLLVTPWPAFDLTTPLGYLRLRIAFTNICHRRKSGMRVTPPAMARLETVPFSRPPNRTPPRLRLLPLVTLL